MASVMKSLVGFSNSRERSRIHVGIEDSEASMGGAYWKKASTRLCTLAKVLEEKVSTMGYGDEEFVN